VIERIGYLPERLRYHLRYTGREYLRYLGQFSGLGGRELEARIEAELNAVGLVDTADRMLSTYSRGMLQRLGVAQALLHDPALLLFDEPTTGLDPSGQRDMFELLTAMRGQGHTILMATHYLDEAEQLCDRVGVLFEGQRATETDATALRMPGRSVTVRVAALAPGMVEQLQQISPAVRCNGADITIEPNTPALQASVIRALLDADIPIVALESRARPLEELYLSVVRGRQQREPATATPHAERAAPPEPAAPEPARPGPSRMGDTLLRELLHRDERGDDKAEEL
jgi:ABC-2 type transport system ATP-binding protein